MYVIVERLESRIKHGVDYSDAVHTMADSSKYFRESGLYNKITCGEPIDRYRRPIVAWKCISEGKGKKKIIRSNVLPRHLQHFSVDFQVPRTSQEERERSTFFFHRSILPTSDIMELNKRIQFDSFEINKFYMNWRYN